MQYKHEKEQKDYSDFASGRVFYNLAGYPAFPVRLASEILQRCTACREMIYKNSDRCVLYDPCCGTAYHLSVLAYLHREHIQEAIGSDVDEKAISVAERNLGLVSIAGLDKRVAEISEMVKLYGKDSHKAALESAHLLKNNALAFAQKYPVKTKAFLANATNGTEIFNTIKNRVVDIVLTDVPYGQHSHWYGSENPVWSMLGALIGILSSSSIVAIASNKEQKVFHESYQRIEQFQLGKRRIVILKPI
jgi:23S rRNA (guanine2535-N1)-methyltransferase